MQHSFPFAFAIRCLYCDFTTIDHRLLAEHIANDHEVIAWLMWARVHNYRHREVYDGT